MSCVTKNLVLKRLEELVVDINELPKTEEVMFGRKMYALTVLSGILTEINKLEFKGDCNGCQTSD